jgi:hypothetical protein
MALRETLSSGRTNVQTNIGKKKGNSAKIEDSIVSSTSILFILKTLLPWMQTG